MFLTLSGRLNTICLDSRVVMLTKVPVNVCTKHESATGMKEMETDSRETRLCMKEEAAGIAWLVGYVPTCGLKSGSWLGEALIKCWRKVWTTEGTGVHGGNPELVRGFLGSCTLNTALKWLSQYRYSSSYLHIAH